MRPPRLLAAVLAIVAVTTIAAQRAGGPILVLISFDGFRADYPDRGLTPTLSALAARGVRARSLISAFPSVTFPNHYAIVTGLRPEHHGVVANNMEDPAWPERFTMAALTAKEPRWWGGEPVWVTARLQGRRAAAVFWPGSEVPIRGILPDYWTVFDDGMPNVDRVGHALDLLSLREEQRPSFLTVYFSEVDHAGHDFGPDSPEMTEAIRHLDDALGQLVAGVRRLGLLDRTVFVVVSDHGMAPLAENRIVFLDDYIDLSTVDVVDWEMPVKLHPRNAAAVDEIYRALKGKHPAMTVYKREELPERFHYRDNPRIQPIILLGNEGWEITSHARRQNDLERHRKRGGAHGYDPQLPSMQGIFIAAGPGIARGKPGPSFENVHVYEFLCRVLGLKPAKNDGDPAVTRAFLTL